MKTNELGEAIEKVISLRDDPRIFYWIGGAVVVLLLFVGYRAWRANAEAARAAAWEQMLEISVLNPDNLAQTITQLRTLAENTSDTNLKRLAELRLSNALIQQAMQSGPDRVQLDEARRRLEALVAPDVPAVIAGPAVFALATLHETLREFDAARTTYELLQEQRFAGSPFQQLAKSRLESLDTLKSPVNFTPGLPPAPPLPTATSLPASGPTSAVSASQPAASRPASAPQP